MKFLHAVVGLLLATVLPIPQLHAEDPFRPAVNAAAAKLLAIMDQRDLKTVTVRGIEDTTTFQASGSVGIERMLNDVLKSSGRLKESGGALGVLGRISAPKSSLPSQSGRRLRIEFKLSDSFGDELMTVDGEYLIAQQDANRVDDNTVMGLDNRLKQRLEVRDGSFKQDFESRNALQVALGSNGPIERFGSDDQLIQNPQSAITSGVIARLSPESRYGVQIISQGRPKLLREVEGLPFVDFQRGESFKIRMQNSDPYPIAVTVTLDGLNSFYFSKTPQQHGTSWIIPGAKSPQRPSVLDLEGWYVQRGVAEKFLATAYESSRLKEAGQSKTPVGGISVLIQSAVPRAKPGSVEGGEMPPDVVISQPFWVEIPQEGGGKATIAVTQSVASMYALVKNVVPRDPSDKLFASVLELDKFLHQEVTPVQLDTLPFKNAGDVEVSSESDDIFVGAGDKTQQIEGDPANLQPGDDIGIITIRYRHPKR